MVLTCSWAEHRSCGRWKEHQCRQDALIRHSGHTAGARRREPQGGARIQLSSDVQPAASRPALAPRSDATMGKCQAGFPEGSAAPPSITQAQIT